MKEQLIHILDQSVCLSRKQMKEYLSGTMQREEMHAAEVHLSSCPLCSMAMEGFEAHTEASLEAIAALNSGFLKDHFDNIAPQIHLNSMAPAAAMPSSARAARKHISIQPIWRNASIAAGILALFGILWYFEFGRNEIADSPSIAKHQQPAPFSSASGGPEKDFTNATVVTDAESQAELPKNDPAIDPVAGNVAAPESPANASDVPTAVPPTIAAAKPKPLPVAQESEAMISGASAKAIEMKAARVNTTPPPDPATHAEKTDVAANLIAREERKQPTQANEVVSLSSQVHTQNRGGGLSIGGGRQSGTKYVVDGVQMSEKENKPDRSHISLGNDAYDRGKYNTALLHYKKQMTTGTSQERSRARIYAARCYVAIGNKSKAQELLDTVIQEGSGPERREARRMLRGLK